jgi:hypothetical protein
MWVVEAVADRGAYAIADKVLALIRSIYNWANATGRLDNNPTFGLKKRNAGRPRERTLSKPEIRALWHALETPSDLSPEIRDALRLWSDTSRHELTGANGCEIEIRERSDLDRARRIAYILSLAGVTKAKL